MTIELTKDVREALIESIERYFRETMDEPIGNLAASDLLSFFLQELGPVVYNQAIEDARDRLATRLEDLPYEMHQEPSQYWQRYARNEKAKR